MRYTVNDNCISCGLCAATCPEVFSISESGYAQAIREEVPAEREAEANDAMESCPVAAIETVE